jgi:hypothetical protein
MASRLISGKMDIYEGIHVDIFPVYWDPPDRRIVGHARPRITKQVMNAG